MKMRLILASILVASAANTAFAQVWPEWSRTAAPDGTFSVETPCTEAELDADRSKPADLGMGILMQPQQRVFCVKGSSVFAASTVSEPAFAARDDKLFDYLKDETLAVETFKGSPRSGEVAGMRAFFNRESRDGGIAETGFVEVSNTTVIFFISGTQNADSEDYNSAIDRFGQSVRLAQ